MKMLLLLALFTVSEGGRIEVVGQTGQKVTLPCNYDINYYKQLGVCWGQGEIPLSGCSNQLISTDGTGVTESLSSKYQLLGPLDEGNVSLTILNLSSSDAGLYGCRVDIPGWFNDDKHHFHLIVHSAPLTPTATGNPETFPENSTASYTTGRLISTETPRNSSSSGVQAEQEDGSRTVVLVCALVGSVVLVAAVAFIIIIPRTRRHLNRCPQQLQPVHGLVRFRSSSSSLQLRRQSSAVENIYQIEEGWNGVMYEN